MPLVIYIEGKWGISMKMFFAVDVQNDFMNPSGSLYVPGARKIKTGIAMLVRHARENGIPLWGSMDYHMHNDPEFKRFPPHCIRGTMGVSLIDEIYQNISVFRSISTNPVELVGPLGLTTDWLPVFFEKQTFDVFTNPLLIDALKLANEQFNVSDVYIFGVATEYCVKAAVLGFLKYGYKVSVIESMIRGVEAKAAKAAIVEMKNAGAHFVSNFIIE